MQDKNGKEIKTGMIVKITGAYFKNDNGLYFVTHSPGDPSWCGSDYGLNKIGKTGKISTAKYRCGFWPLTAYTSDRMKNALAHEWNREHAEIEIIDTVNTAQIKDYFNQQAGNLSERLEWEEYNFGGDYTAKTRAIRDFYAGVAAAL